MKLFQAQGPFESVEFFILGVIVYTTRINRFLHVITHSLTRLVKTVPLKEISADELSRCFMHEALFSDGPLVALVDENGRAFRAKFFQDVSNI